MKYKGEEHHLSPKDLSLDEGLSVQVEESYPDGSSKVAVLRSHNGVVHESATHTVRPGQQFEVQSAHGDITFLG